MLQSGHLGPSGRQRRAAAIVDGIATGKGQQNGDHQQEQGQQRDGNQHPFVHRDQPAGCRRGNDDAGAEFLAAGESVVKAQKSRSGRLSGRRGSAVKRDRPTHQFAKRALEIGVPRFGRTSGDLQRLQKLSAAGDERIEPDTAGLPLQPGLGGQGRRGEDQGGLRPLAVRA